MLRAYVVVHIDYNRIEILISFYQPIIIILLQVISLYQKLSSILCTDHLQRF